nr:YabP/YqfC family sporulation protein [Sedimentibacter sp.]
MKFNNLRSKLADDLEIPNDVVSDNFDMRIHGNRRVIVENHLGLTVYENDLVGIKTKEQTILIKGSKFKIEEINDYKVIIRGVVEEIKINSKE